MATVYEAVDTRLDRPVALKVLPAEFMHDQTFRKRFETEARLIARLEHPNIVPIYNAGIEGSVPWMSMRLLSGGSLSRLLQSQRPDPVEAVRLLRHVASALDYAHAQGVVHRDIKPANILLDATRTAAVADFGLAQMILSPSQLTQTGLVVGTPHYMAPEQALGQRVDHRTDIYSLGIVAYELLAGSPPFAGDSPLAILLKHLSEPLAAPSGPSRSSPWMEPIRKAAAKNAADRWDSAGAFVEALESSLAIGALGSGESEPRRPKLLPPRPRARWVALVGAAALFLVATVWGNRQWSPTRPTDATDTSAIVPPAVASPAENKTTPVSEKQSDRGDLTKSPPAAPRVARGRTQQITPGSDSLTSASSPSAREDSSPVPVPPLPTPSGTAPAVDQLPSAPAITVPTGTADVSTNAEIIREVHPQYPAAAKTIQVEGVVVLSGLVGVDGRISEIGIVRPAHRLLVEAAQKAFLQWQFKPASRNGQPVPQRITREFAFKMPR